MRDLSLPNPREGAIMASQLPRIRVMSVQCNNRQGGKHVSQQLSKVRNKVWGLMGGVALGLAIFSVNVVADDFYHSGSGFEGESRPSLTEPVPKAQCGRGDH